MATQPGTELVPRTAESLIVDLRPQAQEALTTALTMLSEKCALERHELAVSELKRLGIPNDVELRRADELLGSVARGADAVDALCKPHTKAAYDFHRGLTKIQGEFKQRWTTMDEILRKLILQYKRKQAEQQAEQQRQIELAAQAERDRLAAEARKALRNGDMSAATDAMKRVQSVVTPVLATSTPKLENSRERQVWEVAVTDPMAFVKCIADGIIPLSAIKEFDLVYLKREAAKRGGLPPEWKGVTAKQEDALSVPR